MTSIHRAHLPVPDTLPPGGTPSPDVPVVPPDAPPAPPEVDPPAPGSPAPIGEPPPDPPPERAAAGSAFGEYMA